jgi:MFS family permease
VLAVFLQTGFGLSPLQSGLTTVPFPLGVLIASVISGRLGSRWPRERIAAGAAMLIVGMVILRFIVSGVGEALDHWHFFLPLFLSGLGMGWAIAPLFQTVLWSVPPRDSGSGSGALQSFQQIGSALGIAATGQIFFSSLEGRLSSGTAAHPAFIGSMSAALLYEMAAFAVVAVLVFFLKPPAQRQEGGHGSAQPRPVTAET